MKNKFTKLLALICVFSLCIGGGAVDAFASDSNSKVACSIELNDAIYSSVPEALIVPLVDLNTKAPPLESGEHRYYFTSSGKYFTIDKGTSVSVTVKTNVNSSVKIGYYKVGESDVTTYTSGARKTNHTTTITIPADGQYSIWIYNNGSDAFTVTGGSIVY